MLKLTSRVGPKRLSSGLKSSSFKVNATIISKKFQSSLNSKPNEVYTKLSDSEDPKRHQFFQYTWGSWMKNNQSEKSKRETRFSIEGITKLLQDLNVELKNQRNIDKSGEPFVKAPSQLKDGSYVLTQNLTSNLIGKDDSLLVKSIASIHEGKHNRIYKVTLSTGKELVLRIPYKLESEYSISQKIKSEVATMDFLNLKLGANVPKVVAYGANKVNSLQSPFILMEHIEGDLLMKQWDPLVADETEGSQEKLKSVIEPIAAFQEKLLSITFNKFGSLYFNDDVSVTDQSSLPYNGEENPLLTKRWRIGPSVEKSFSKNKNQLSEKEIKQYNKSIDADKPLETITSIAGIELENLRNRLALAQADSGNKVENVDLIQKMIATFENLKTMSTKLFNPNSQSLMNAEELFKPRLYCPDLDPLNVILNSNKNNEPYFVDFEYTCIKPFILSSYPSFVGYQGAKIYNLEEDIPGYSEMDEVEKQQYQFMYYKTRNERLWELELNSRKHDLIAVASPHVKVLKSPYVQALDFKNDKDYLYIEGSIVQLQAMWEAYVANELCNATETEFPIAFTAEYLDEHQKDIEDYQMEIVSTPFAATGGWVPQDMFDSLKEQGIIVETENGDFKVETENVLKESE